jgi:hypothetical protein
MSKKARPVPRPEPAPPASTGYSGTPLPRKLGLAAGQCLAFVEAPPEFARWLGPLPDGTRDASATAEPLDLVVLFATAVADLVAAFPAWTARLAPAGMLWVAWPKKAAKVATDLTEDRVREVGLAAGLVDVKVCAISAVWSGLKFVRRRADR